VYKLGAFVTFAHSAQSPSRATHKAIRPVPFGSYVWAENNLLKYGTVSPNSLHLYCIS